MPWSGALAGGRSLRRDGLVQYLTAAGGVTVNENVCPLPDMSVDKVPARLQPASLRKVTVPLNVIVPLPRMTS